jgi:N-acetylglucosaminylphosphatidylinositol deacetylase
VTDHPNHISLFHGVSHLLASSPTGIGYPAVAYSLKSKPVVIKYTAILAPVLIKLKAGLYKGLERLVHSAEGNNTVPATRPLFVAGMGDYRRAIVAILRHQSQSVWFRWLNMAFSQFIWVNEYERIHADKGTL